MGGFRNFRCVASEMHDWEVRASAVVHLTVNGCQRALGVFMRYSLTRTFHFCWRCVRRLGPPLLPYLQENRKQKVAYRDMRNIMRCGCNIRASKGIAAAFQRDMEDKVAAAICCTWPCGMALLDTLPLHVAICSSVKRL